MSTLAVERVENHPSARSLALEPEPALVTESKPAESATFIDQHPLVPVFIAGFIALAMSFAMVGSILMWLSLRHSGVFAP